MKITNIELEDPAISEQEIFLKVQNNYHQLLVEFMENGTIQGGHLITSRTCLVSPADKIFLDKEFLEEVEKTLAISNEKLQWWPDLENKYDVMEKVVLAYQDQRDLFTQVIEKFKDKKKSSLLDVLGKDTEILAIRKTILNIERILLMLMYRVYNYNTQKEEERKFLQLCDMAEADLKNLKDDWNIFDSNGDYTEKVFYTLRDNIKRTVGSITEAARQWNVTVTVFGHDSSANTELFNLNIADEKYQKVRDIFSDFCVIATEIGETQFDNIEGGLSEQWTDFQSQLQFKEKERKFNNDAQYNKVESGIPNPVDLNNTKVLSTAGKVMEDIDDKSKRDNKPVIASNNHQYAAAIQFLQETTSSAKKILNKVPKAKKGQVEYSLEELSQEVERGRKILATTEGEKQDRENLGTLIQEARNLKDLLSDRLDEIDDLKVMQSQLPKASFPVWNTDPEDYFNFRRLMEALLPGLADDTLKVNTIKSKIVGKDAEDILKEIRNIDNPDDVWKRLDKRFGNILIQLSHIEKRLKKLKEFPEDFKTELNNTRELLQYVYVCRTYGGEDSLTTSFTIKYASKLSKINALKLMRAKGDRDEIIRVLEEVLDENERLVNISGK